MLLMMSRGNKKRNWRCVMKSIVAVLYYVLVICMVQTVYADSNQPAVALKGYDVVSYFAVSRAEKGSEKYAHEYNGKVYYFNSDEHRTLFESDPEKYLPAYDGYCAYGVTVGRKLEASPEAWKIVNGKLYLNLNKEFLADWSKNVSQSIEEGNDQWELIKNIPPGDL